MSSTNDPKDEKGEEHNDSIDDDDKKSDSGAVSRLRYKDSINDGVSSERQSSSFSSTTFAIDSSLLTESAQALPEESFLSAGRTRRTSSSSTVQLFPWSPPLVQHRIPSATNMDDQDDVPMVVAKPILTPGATREAELQARIAQLEQQDRQQLDRQQSVDTETSKTVAQSSSIHENKRSWSRVFTIAVTIGIVLLMIVLIPVLAMSGESPEDNVVFLDSSQDIMDTIRSATLVSNTTAPTNDSNNTLEEKALAWVLEEFETGTTRFTRESLLQRYALASILFASPRQQVDHNHECTWPGVKCSMPQQGEVTELHLPYFGLAGTIPPDVGLLTSLTRFRVENNTLTGPLPDSIGNLSQLIVLHLFNNALSGTIPSTLSRLSLLVELRCGQNEFTGPLDPTRLSPSLAWISFFRNRLTGSIPESLGRLSSVQAMVLSHNQLTGSLPVAFWTRLPQLSHLLLNDNRLTGRLPGSYNNMRLERLEIRDNFLTGEIPRWTARVSDLDLDGNNFTTS